MEFDAKQGLVIKGHQDIKRERVGVGEESRGRDWGVESQECGGQEK